MLSPIPCFQPVSLSVTHSTHSHSVIQSPHSASSTSHSLSRPARSSSQSPRHGDSQPRTLPHVCMYLCKFIQTDMLATGASISVSIEFIASLRRSVSVASLLSVACNIVLCFHLSSWFERRTWGHAQLHTYVYVYIDTYIYTDEICIHVC